MISEFGEYIRILRTERNLSLRQLADIIGISPYYLSYIEQGKKKNPSKKIMAAMFLALNLNKGEIETCLDFHAQANGIVSLDLVDFIMTNDSIRDELRDLRDKSGVSSNWIDFIENLK